jgi:proteasome accessory factor A
MGDLFEPEAVQACAALFETAASPADALAAWTRRKEA